MRRLGVLACLLVSILLLGPSYLEAGGSEFVFWNHYMLHHQLNEKWKVRLETEYRLSEDAERLQFHYAQFNLLYLPTSWLELGPGYRQGRVRVHRKTPPMRQVYDAMLEACITIPLDTWRLFVRQRFEFARIDGTETLYAYRIRLRAQSPYLLACLPIRFVASEEVFYLFDHRRWAQSRLKVGGRWEPSKGFRLHIFYLLRFLLGRTEQGLGVYLSFYPDLR